MAQQLGQVAVGSIVKLNENGSPVNYIVVHNGLPSSMYDASCNGTWVRRQNILQNRRWTTNNVNAYGGSSINTYLNGTFLNVFPEDIRAAIKQVKIPYLPLGNGSNLISGADGLSCKIFLLSGAEVGFNRNTSALYYGQSLDGNDLSYFSDSSARDKRIATLNDEPSPYWLRTPSDDNTTAVGTVEPDGSADTTPCSWTDVGVLPAFVLPSNLTVSDDGSVSTAPLPPSAIDVPQTAMQGNQLSVSWTEVDGADGYILERKADTDADWTQVYSGDGLTFTETAGSWTTVQYRVKAGASGNYGDYITSAAVSVVLASALEISGTDGDLGTLIDDVSYIVFSDGTGALTVTETINGVSRTYTAVNGAANKISVLDLPTGSGTIKISASTDPGSGVVTAARSWTYTKEAITFPDAGGVADLIQNGQTIWAKTLAEAVRVPGIWGGNMGLALSKLAQAMLYDPSDGTAENVSGENIPMLRLEMGSYVGTGTYGEENPNTLTFSSHPKVIFIFGNTRFGENAGSSDNLTVLLDGVTNYVTSTNENSIRYTNAVVTWLDNGVSWYSVNSAGGSDYENFTALQQLNDSGATYRIVALCLAGGAS